MDNNEIFKIAEDAVKIYFACNCTAKQAIEESKRIYKSNKMQVDKTNQYL